MEDNHTGNIESSYDIGLTCWVRHPDESDSGSRSAAMGKRGSLSWDKPGVLTVGSSAGYIGTLVFRAVASDP